MWNTDYIDYYVYLENLRKSGTTNMFGATPYLASAFGLNKREARTILASWMEHYDSLKKAGVI